MATTIEVNKQSVKQLLETGKTQKFIIPDYQRPYEWKEDHIQVLFDDLTEYTRNNSESTYFLGSIVSFVNDYNEQEIIDGQQRITSLFLLLRSIYTKLCTMTETKEVLNFKSQIESALWQQNELTAEVDYENILIFSKVMGDEGNAVFADILITGQAKEKAKDNYSLNYNIFTKLVEQYSATEPELFFWFIRNVLNKAILLPITADSQDTALTIFSTLNDRGMALSDADIFKAKIYSNLESTEKLRFIEKWRQLDEDAANTNESVQKLFYYYMFYLRAVEGDRDTTTPGLRKYYSRKNFEQLYKKSVIFDLYTLLNLWRVVNSREEIEGEAWSKNIEIKQTLDALSSYPNEFWKYPVVTYYLKYRTDENFEILFLAFAKKLLAMLTARYVITPTINAVKRGILNLNAKVITSPKPKFDFEMVNENELREKIKNPHTGMVRVVLKMLTYEHQKELLPANWEIEHIMPQKWQSMFFTNTPDTETKSLIQHIGNKIPFEKKLNIIASNGYFKKKQEVYKKSKINIVLELAEKYNDWDLDKIRERDIRISDEILKLLFSWGLNES